MQMKNCWILALLLLVLSCQNRQQKAGGSSEVVIRESDNVYAGTPVAEETDSVPNGPFVSNVTYLKDDNNGGYERYDLAMNLYEGNIPDGEGGLCYGTLVLYVKSPDSVEGIEIARRIIHSVYQVNESEAKVQMSTQGEAPVVFEAIITHDPEAHTYHLSMQTDSGTVDDLMENNLTLE